MTLLVDYWNQTEPTPAVQGQTQDEFSYTNLNPNSWSSLDNDFAAGNVGSVNANGQGQLAVILTNDYPYTPRAQEFAETVKRFPNQPWTCYTAIRFTSNASDHTDLRLGYRFEMADGSYAYLLLDSAKGMQVRYGNHVQSNDGPNLYQNWWYELKFNWSGSELRAWYREKGRSIWLGGTSNAGLVLYSAFPSHPERVKIGQTDIAYPTGDVTMTLLVDYWNQTEPTPAVEAHTDDEFSFTDLDLTKWTALDNDFASGNAGNVDPDEQGYLTVTVTNDYPYTPRAQEFAETVSRLPDQPWTYYTSIVFSSTATNRTDLKLGFRFELTDGHWAFVGFDSAAGMTLKYGNDNALSNGSTLAQNTPYELMVSWTGQVLRASYRPNGQNAWLGDYVLTNSTSAWPERVRIGQTDIAYPASDVTMTLKVDYWRHEGEPMAPGDFDADGDVDLDDFVNWADCETGPNRGPYSPGCEVFDFESDGDVDLQDFAGFQRAFTGPP
jgi:hypothetical protein